MSEPKSILATTVRPRTTQSTAPARVSSKELLGIRGELIIEHDGREYRLRLTQSIDKNNLKLGEGFNIYNCSRSASLALAGKY